MPRWKKSAAKAPFATSCSHYNAIHDSQMRSATVLRLQLQLRGALTQLQTLSCKAQENYAQRLHKLQRFCSSKTGSRRQSGKTTILKENHECQDEKNCFQSTVGNLHANLYIQIASIIHENVAFVRGFLQIPKVEDVKTKLLCAAFVTTTTTTTTTTPPTTSSVLVLLLLLLLLPPPLLLLLLRRRRRRLLLLLLVVLLYYYYYYYYYYC